MSNEYYQAGSTPATNSPGSSAAIRAQFTAIAAAFDKMPTMAGSEGEFVVVNDTGTALIASGYIFSDVLFVDGTQTVINKTLAWADNTWPGFGTGATKNAGTSAGEVLLLAEDSKLPALDGSALTSLPPDAELTGTPIAPTPATGTQTNQIATTEFVYDVLAEAEAAVPSDATPLINGVPTSGTHITVSRDDHVHPVDISRAPASAATAGGTSFTPVGTISANNVQGAIQELLVETAPASAGTAVGTSFTPAGTIAATDVQAAIQELDSETQTSFGNVATQISDLDTYKVEKTSNTGSALIPAGTTAQRDGSPVYGATRANSTLNQMEWWNGTAWVPMGGGATGAPGNNVFVENDIHVTGNYTISAGKNAMSAGPITIDDGVTVTVPNGSVWSIV